jgi:hypothetical protein
LISRATLAAASGAFGRMRVEVVRDLDRETVDLLRKDLGPTLPCLLEPTDAKIAALA